MCTCILDGRLLAVRVVDLSEGQRFDPCKDAGINAIVPLMQHPVFVSLLTEIASV